MVVVHHQVALASSRSPDAITSKTHASLFWRAHCMHVFSAAWRRSSSSLDSTFPEDTNWGLVFARRHFSFGAWGGRSTEKSLGSDSKTCHTVASQGLASDKVAHQTSAVLQTVHVNMDANNKSKDTRLLEQGAAGECRMGAPTNSEMSHTSFTKSLKVASARLLWALLATVKKCCFLPCWA